MKLLIVESPAKAKTISKYLDGAFTVVASVGHIRDLPKSNKKAIDIPAGFGPHYEISKGKEKIVSEIKSLANKADEILLGAGTVMLPPAEHATLREGRFYLALYTRASPRGEARVQVLPK